VRPQPPALRRITDPALGYAALVALFTFATLGHEPYDDAYFFKRFALNALDHGVLAWNVADGPVYGVTSQLFQALALAVAALTRDHWMLAMRLLLAALLVTAFAILLATTRRFDRGVAAAVAFCSPVALHSATSGMETALCFALLAGLLWLLLDERGRNRHWGWAPLLVFLIWLTRPDATLLALPPLIFVRWSERGRPPLRELALVGAAIGFSLGVFKLYYGTALPLPFYAKQLLLSPYDAHFLELSAQVQRLRFGGFLLVALPLALVALLRRDRTNLALLGAVLVFEAYHLATTIEVMGMHGRFYAPALPLLALAAARGADALSPRSALLFAAIYGGTFAALATASWLPTARSGLDGVHLAYHGVSALGALLLFGPLFMPRLAHWRSPALMAALAAAIVIADPPRWRAPPSDAEYLDLHVSRFTVYRGIHALRHCFGDAITVYHSEIGVPGLFFAGGKVVDQAGLMSKEWLFRRQSFDVLCAADRPEAIFLPHKNYRDLNAEIGRGSCIRGYRRVVEESSSPLYVRADLTARYADCDSGH
jgi:hypothetical protein